MRHEHGISAFLFLAITVFLVGSHRLAVSLADTDLLSPVADVSVAYDWKALDQRLKTLEMGDDVHLPATKPIRAKTGVQQAPTVPQPTSVPVVRIASARSTPLSPRAEIEAYVEKVFGKYAKRAKAIIACESSWNPAAVNNSNRDKSNDKGLWQINSIHGLSDACRLDYKCSTDYAYKLFKRSGFQPWYSSRKCHGLK